MASLKDNVSLDTKSKKNSYKAEQGIHGQPNKMDDLATADTDKFSHISVTGEKGHGDLPAVHENSVRNYLR